MTGLNEAEESRNEGLDFKEKITKSLLLPVMKLCENFKSLILFTSRHRLYCLNIYSFQNEFCPLSYTQIYNSSCKLS